MKKEIGDRIAVLRRNAGINQGLLAKHIHVCTSAIGMYEQGRRIPGVDVLVDIAEYFDVSLDYLITGHERPFLTGGNRIGDEQGVYICEQERAAIVSLAKKLWMYPAQEKEESETDRKMSDLSCSVNI